MEPTSLKAVDIEHSMKRLKAAFEGDYKAVPIKEDGRPIGFIQSDQDRIYITFRGTVDSFRELLSCLDLRKRTLNTEQTGLQGKVHRGIANAFDKTREAVSTHLQQLPTHREIIVEGYSRGAGIALLMGAYLSKQLAKRKISVLTYSPMKIFDQAAASSYPKTVSTIYSFIFEKDLVPKWWAPACLGFVSVGKQFVFHAKELPKYTQRVRDKVYLHLIRGEEKLSWSSLLTNCLHEIIKMILPATLWEAHMPETYAEGAPQAFQADQKRS